MVLMSNPHKAKQEVMPGQHRKAVLRWPPHTTKNSSIIGHLHWAFGIRNYQEMGWFPTEKTNKQTKSPYIDS